MNKKLLKYLFLFLATAATLELGLRVLGVFDTITEKRGHGFYTDMGGGQDSWFYTWMPSDSHLVDHGEFQYLYHANSWGYRDDEPNWDDSASIRLLAFGDSFTEGIGAAQDSTWPAHVADLLQKMYPRTDVINLGMSAADPFFNFVELRERAIELNPSHVIFAINSSDISDYLNRGGMERFKPDGTVEFRSAPWFTPAYRHSHFFRFVATIIGYDQQLHNRFMRKRNFRNARKSIANCLVDVAELCAEQDIAFMAAFMPMPLELCYQENLIIDGFKSYYDSAAIFLSDDLKTYFNDQVDCGAQEVFWPVDGHFTAKGYEMVAKSILSGIDEHYSDFWSTQPCGQ